jgi:ATP-dependent DNA helicase RecG
MCNELALEGIKEPHYNLVAFILKTTVLACIIDEKGIKEGLKKDVKGLKKGIKGLNKELDEGLKKGVKGLNKGLKTDLNERNKSTHDILAVLRENPAATYINLAEKCKISIKLVRTILGELKGSHIITRVGPKRGGFWKIEDEKNL